METGKDLNIILQAVADKRISPEEALQQIQADSFLSVGNVACIDINRQKRCGIPEVVLAEGKHPDHLLAIARSYVQSAGRCVISRLDPLVADQICGWAHTDGITCTWSEEGRILVLSTISPQEKTGGLVGIITAGTSDIRVAEEARVIATEMGCDVRTAYDVGVAGIHRLFPALADLTSCHAYVVAAGREGTLPAIVAGLVSRPVIGVPVSTGYGYMGAGQAALASMLQSCSVLTVVNIDAGFVAGAYAAMIANLVVER